MFLLDTNILSELMRLKPIPQVIEWMDNQPIDELAISSITVAEIRLGIALLPDGKRKNKLASLAEGMLQEFLDSQLDFDNTAAGEYAIIVSHCTRQGRAISTEDAQIASIVRVHDAVLVTRNTRDFEMIEDLELFDPFV